VKLKKLYSSREVAVMTGLTARQLQWWDARRLFTSAVASHRTEAGGFTERRYTPLDVLELQVLAELRRRSFSIPRLRRLLVTLRDVFGIRLYEAIGEGGPVTLMVAGDQLYVKALDGRLFDLEQPTQALLMSEDSLGLRVLAPRERRRRTPGLRRSSGSETPSPGRRRDGESRGRQ
jgi:DNA-binding transcriptional MerR regulator